MTCTAPHPTFPACCTPPESLSLEDRIRRNPNLTLGMAPNTIAMNVPLGSMLMVAYRPANPGRSNPFAPRTPAASFGLENLYFGRITSREDRGSYVIFRMQCTLTRGTPGAPEFRMFSTRTGDLIAVQLMELPTRRPDLPGVHEVA